MKLMRHRRFLTDYGAKIPVFRVAFKSSVFSFSEELKCYSKSKIFIQPRRKLRSSSLPFATCEAATMGSHF